MSLAFLTLLLALFSLEASAADDAGQCVTPDCSSADPLRARQVKQVQEYRIGYAQRYLEVATTQTQEWVNAKQPDQQARAFRLAVNSIIAALEHDPEEAQMWAECAHLLLRLTLQRKDRSAANPYIALKFIQNAVSIDSKIGGAAVKKSLDVMGLIDPKREQKTIWGQLEKWEEARGSVMRVEDLAIDATDRRTTRMRSLDALFKLAPRDSSYLIDHQDIVDDGLLTTHLLWPARVSVINLIESGYLTAEENSLVTKACTSALDKFVGTVETKDESAISNQFFMHQKHEVYDPEDKTFTSKVFDQKEHAESVHKLWRFQHELSIQHILSNKNKPQNASEFAGNVLFPWCAVYSENASHGAHVHDDANLVSGVYYSQAPESSAPLVLSDPRGGTHIYKQSDIFLPNAPFHHQYHFYPKAGDMILFPSYLVHQVAKTSADATLRVAWPFNLFGDLDALTRVNT